MKETNLNIFCNLGASLSYLRVRTSINLSVTEAYMLMELPQKWLTAFLNETKEFFDVELKDSRAAANALLDTILTILENIPANWGRKITGPEALLIYDGISAFEAAFEREHHNLTVFTVTRKGIYDTRALIERPEEVFPVKLQPILGKQMLDDLKQAGRCLAFDIPTACAFHVCRGTEAVMIEYLELLMKQPWPHPKSRDWHAYIQHMENNGAPAKITDRLNEIRMSDRNPYSHPDVNVPLEEAPIIFGLCTNVVFLMGQEMIKLIP